MTVSENIARMAYSQFNRRMFICLIFNQLFCAFNLLPRWVYLFSSFFFAMKLPMTTTHHWHWIKCESALLTCIHWTIGNQMCQKSLHKLNNSQLLRIDSFWICIFRVCFCCLSWQLLYLIGPFFFIDSCDCISNKMICFCESQHHFNEL